jgi:hypothetical protein
MSELIFGQDEQRQFAERLVRKFAGGSLGIVSSEGYWQIADSQGPEKDAKPSQTAVSAKRQYSLGIIAEGEVQVEEDGIVVPVEELVTWNSSVPYVQDLTSRFEWGFEWLDADIVAGEGGLVLPRIKDVHDPERAWDFGKRVATNGGTLGLLPGMRVEKTDTAPAGMVTGTFAEVDCSVNAAVGGNSGSRYIKTGEEQRDTLLRRIIAGDVSALKEAANPDIKEAAAEAAREDLKRNPPKASDYDPWDPLA